MQDFSFPHIFDTSRKLDVKRKHSVKISDRAWQYLNSNGGAGQAIEIMVIQNVNWLFTINFFVEPETGKIDAGYSTVIRPTKIMSGLAKIIEAYKEGKEGYQSDDFSKGLEDLISLLDEQLIPSHHVKHY